MPAGNTYVALATQTLGSNTNTVTFSSISSAYTDLVIVANGTVTVNTDAPWLQFNGDTGSNYSTTILQGNGTSATSTRYTSQTKIFSNYQYGWYNGNNNTTIAHIMNYSNSTTYKTVLIRDTNPTADTSAGVGLWRSTAAITSISIIAGGSNFATGTTFSLYGILAA